MGNDTYRGSLILPSNKAEADRLIREARNARGGRPVSLEFAQLELDQLDSEMNALQSAVRSISFGRSTYGDLVAFFAEANKDYDSDLQNPYWSLTHEILRFIIATHLRLHFGVRTDISVFDAGAGTGNWSDFVLSLSHGFSGILFDMNPDMLKHAHAKMRRHTANRIRLVEGNLEQLSDYPTDSSNLILCMHNVIGLGRDTELILRNLYTYLEPGGLAFLMAMNKYHAFRFTKSYRGEMEALRVITDGTVKFKPDMPEMFCYSPEEFRQRIEQAGFSEVTVLGFPVTVYPSQGDTKLLTRSSPDLRLMDAVERLRILEVEKRLCLCPWLAYRGASSLIAIAKKQ